MRPDLDLSGAEYPEMVFGLVGALGTPLRDIESSLAKVLNELEYKVVPIKLSEFLEAYDNLKTPHPDKSTDSGERFGALMDRGNQLREKLERGDALAMHVAAQLNSRRAKEPPRLLERRAFVLHQLKHPEEVQLLRRIYGDGFHLIGIYTPEDSRMEYLNKEREVFERVARELIERDAGEEVTLGQQVTKTYHLADVFVRVSTYGDKAIEEAKPQLERYVDLMFGRKIITPTRHEYGMFLASSAALRSGDLSRQVGAAILSEQGEVLGVGSNEVPMAGGGQYWEGCGANRDVERRFDSNEKLKNECLEEVLALYTDNWSKKERGEKDEIVAEASERLKNTRLMNLTEFGRAVHAEMEAILSAGRIGVSVRGGVLYSTTFPCHNCAKHIVASGLEKIYFIEPYAKSLAARLHGDAIAIQVEGEEGAGGKVQFESFQGVSPRRFGRLFSSLEADGSKLARKEKGGNLRVDTIKLRLKANPTTHIDRESAAAQFLKDEMDYLGTLEKEGADG